MSILEITLAYILGIKWGLYQDLKILIGSLIFLLIFTLIYKKEKFNKVIILTIFCLIGSIYVKLKFNYMDTKYEEKEIETEITIITHESTSLNGYSYKYNVKNNSNDKFILYVKKKDENIFDIGTKIKVIGEFNKPDVSRNFGGFDYQKYLYSNNIYGTINATQIEIINSNTNNLVYIIQNKIRENMLEIFDKETAGVLVGMIIGETNDISKTAQDNFKTSRCYTFTCGFWCECDAYHFYF